MKLGTLTFDRGDRPQFMRFCVEQLDRMNRGYQAIIVCDPPTDHQFDLVKRFKHGYQLAKENGIDWLFVIESDDAYRSNYLEDMASHTANGVEFIGYSDTFYYNIRNRTWMNQTHPGRSSLFTTGFKVSALDDFIWPADHYLWLDIRLWEHARDKRKKVKLLSNNPCTGVKHGVGMCAGKAHKRRLEHDDPNMEFLKSRVEDYQYEFYSKLKL